MRNLIILIAFFLFALFVFVSPSWATTTFNENIQVHGNINASGTLTASGVMNGVSVLGFGAIGNGVADDTTAIQNAIASAQCTNGCVVYFPAGTYKVTSEIQIGDNIHLLGDGPNASILKTATAGITILHVIGSYSGARRLGFTTTAIRTSAIRVTPLDESQTITKVNQNYNVFSDLSISSFTEGIVVQCGPNVTGAASGCWFNSFENVVGTNNTRHIWLKGPPNTNGSAVVRNRFSNFTLNGGNAGVHIESGGGNEFFHINSNGQTVSATNEYKFTVTSANATKGATYTNNAFTFTVLGTIASGTTLLAYSTGSPLASGTLTKSGGTGDATITFSASAGYPNASGTFIYVAQSDPNAGSNEQNRFWGGTDETSTVSIENHSVFSEIYGMDLPGTQTLASVPLMMIGGYSPSVMPQVMPWFIWQGNSQLSGYDNNVMEALGGLLWHTDNASDVGKSTSKRPRAIYAASSVNVGTWTPVTGSGSNYKAQFQGGAGNYGNTVNIATDGTGNALGIFTQDYNNSTNTGSRTIMGLAGGTGNHNGYIQVTTSGSSNNDLLTINPNGGDVALGGSGTSIYANNLGTGTNADFMCVSGIGKLLIQSSACTISSRRFKENIKDLRAREGLSQVMRLRPVEFKMKRGAKPNPDKNYERLQTGLIAEDVAEVDRRLVVYEDDMKTPKSYRQEAVIAVLVKAVQEQQAEIRDLRARISEIE